MRFYEALGVEPRLTLDPDDLKKRFYERSRQWHPDRFGRASAPEQQKALEMTASVERRLSHAARSRNPGRVFSGGKPDRGVETAASPSCWKKSSR